MSSILRQAPSFITGFGTLRLVFAMLFLGWSLLTIFQAPTIFLWRLAIIATEYGHWLLILPLFLIVGEVFSLKSCTTIYTIFLALLAAVLFISPTYQAWCLARYLPLQLGEAYGPSSLPPTPLSIPSLWIPPAGPTIAQHPLEFTTGDGSKLAMGFYSSALPGLRPCVLVLHGGGWSTGNYRQVPGPSFSKALAAAGYHVAAIDYRLAPKNKWPAPKEDLLAAIAFLRSKSTTLQIDPDRLIVLGRSAGGQIALATAYSAHDPGIRGCISLYAPTDMVFAYQYGSDDDILQSRGLIRSYMGGSLQDLTEKYQDASPLHLVGPETPPTLLIHGVRDELVWYLHAHRLQTSMLQAHRSFFLLEMPWATHAFDLNVNGPAGQLSLYTIRWFIESVTK